MSIAVIHGASGALGSALARHLLSHTRLTVVGTSRSPSSARRQILGEGRTPEMEDRLEVLEVDARDEGSIERAARRVRDMGGGEARVRAVVNASGVLHADKSVTQISAQELLESYQLNTFAHILSYKHFVPLLPTRAGLRRARERGEEDLADGMIPPGLSVVASLTARVGSIGDNKLGGWMAYRSSKAAMNQVIATLQRELAHKSVPAIAVALHPGTVVGTPLSSAWTTPADAGTRRGVFTADESARRLWGVVAGLGEGDGGRFWDWEGREVVW